MEGAKEKKAVRKQKFVQEMKVYFGNVIYLAFFFGLFTWYRRLILDAHGISYLHYGVSLIQALVLGKVIVVGDFLRLGRRFEDKPLIFTILNKAVVFSIFVGIFSVLEETVSGFLEGGGWRAGLDGLVSKGGYELLAKCLVIFFAFIPFFAYKELGRVVGKEKLRELFLGRRSDIETDLSGNKME